MKTYTEKTWTRFWLLFILVMPRCGVTIKRFFLDGIWLGLVFMKSWSLVFFCCPITQGSALWALWHNKILKILLFQLSLLLMVWKYTEICLRHLTIFFICVAKLDHEISWCYFKEKVKSSAIHQTSLALQVWWYYLIFFLH